MSYGYTRPWLKLGKGWCVGFVFNGWIVSLYRGHFTCRPNIWRKSKQAIDKA